MKKIVRLTESDLVRIVNRVINEGAIVHMPFAWNKIENLQKGEGFKFDGMFSVRMTNGKPNGEFTDFRIIQNPSQVQLKQGGVFNVSSFDNVKKIVTFDNGLVIGPK